MENEFFNFDENTEEKSKLEKERIEADLTPGDKLKNNAKEVGDKGRPERNRDLEKARENLAEMSDNTEKDNEDVSSSKEKVSPSQFRKDVEKKPEEFIGSKTEEAVNYIRDTFSNSKTCERPRKKYAEVVSKSIIEVLTKAKISNDELKNIKEIIDVGGGYGDNLEAIIQKIEEASGNETKINGVCLDNKTSPSKNVEKNEQITGSYQDVFDMSFKDNSFDLVMATHLLQEIDGIENKEDILQKLIKISKGRIVLMVEEKRSGVDGMKDKIIHFANNFNTKFDVLDEKGYQDLFERLGLAIEAEVKSEPNKITYLLKFEKKKQNNN